MKRSGLLAAICLVLLVVVPVWAGDVNIGQLGMHNEVEDINNNEANANANATAYGGMGIGVGMGGHSDVDVTVDTTDVNIVDTTDINLVHQDQDQSQSQGQSQYSNQGQMQGQSVDNRDTFIYNAPRGFMGNPSAYKTDDFQELPAGEGYSNAYFWFPDSCTVTVVESMQYDIGYSWGTDMTVKVLQKLPRKWAGGPYAVEASVSIEKVDKALGVPLAIISCRGNTRTMAYEVVGKALTKALELGAKRYLVADYGFETRGRGLNIGVGGSVSTQVINSEAANRATGSTGGLGLSWGTSATKARPYVTLLVF